MNQKGIVGLVAVIALLWLALNAIFLVDVNHLALVKRGISKQVALLQPGLHWRLPFIDEVTMVDSRQRVDYLSPVTLDVKGQKAGALLANSYLLWQVRAADAFLKDGKRTASQAQQQLLTRVSQTLETELAAVLKAQSLPDLLAGDYQARLNALVARLNESLDAVGVEVLQLGLLDVSWSQDATNAAYASMKAGLQAKLKAQQAKTQLDLAEFKAAAAAKRASLMADAKRKAQQLRATGDAEAARLYAESYGADPEFYAFYRSLQAYKAAFDADDILVLDTDSDFFRYFRKLQAR